MAHHPADVAGREKGFARPAVVDVLHRRRQCHGVAAGVALHAFGLAGGAAGVQRVAGVRGVHPFAGHLGIQVFFALGAPQTVATSYQIHSRQATIDQQHRIGLVLRQVDGFVQQRLVGHRLAAARTGVGTDDDLGFGVVDACGQRARRKAAEHHAMQRADARAGQHGKAGLGDHGHVDQHAVAFLHAQPFQHRRHALHFGVQLAEGVDLFLIGLGRDEDQRRLVGAVFQVAIDRVVAEIGGAPDKPLGKRRLAVVANRLRRRLPVDQLGLFGPEGVAVVDGTTVKVGVARHACLLGPGCMARCSGAPWLPARPSPRF